MTFLTLNFLCNSNFRSFFWGEGGLPVYKLCSSESQLKQNEWIFNNFICILIWIQVSSANWYIKWMWWIERVNQGNLGNTFSKNILGITVKLFFLSILITLLLIFPFWLYSSIKWNVLNCGKKIKPIFSLSHFCRSQPKTDTD